MTRQVLLDGETLPTDLTDVRLLLRVHLHVLLQVGKLAQTLAADLADEGRSLVGVCRHVTLHRHFLRERTQAHWTHVRFLASMKHSVATEVSGVRERRTTRLATVQSLP